MQWLNKLDKKFIINNMKKWVKTLGRGAVFNHLSCKVFKLNVKTGYSIENYSFQNQEANIQLQNCTFYILPLYLTFRAQAKDFSFGTVLQDQLIKTPYLHWEIWGKLSPLVMSRSLLTNRSCWQTSAKSGPHGMLHTAPIHMEK